MAWWVYILECGDGSLYTGMTKDVDARVKTHKSGKGSKYVAARGVSKMLCKKQCKDRSEAAKIEALIKKLPRSHKIPFLKSLP